MNLTFLYNQSELDFLLFLIREQTLDLGRCRIQTCNQSARKPKPPEASFVVRKTFSHHQRTQTHKLRKNVGRHFEIENFSSHSLVLTRFDGSLAHTHTHTSSPSHARTRVQVEKRNGVVIVMSWRYSWSRLCVCVRAPASSVSRTTGTHVTFPSRNSWNTSNKVRKKNGVRVQCFRFALGSPPPNRWSK